MPIDPANWLLTPSSLGDGKPWGTGTNMAKRAMKTSKPWDEGCKVTTLIDGYAAMSEMRDALENLIDYTKSHLSDNPPGKRGHVYIAGWRFNCQRDLSSKNQWKTGTWSAATTSNFKDQTAIGLLLRLMQCGVAVRVLVWFPALAQSLPAGIMPHVLDHTYLWKVVKKENDRLTAKDKPVVPLGIVGLDRRTASGALASAHHQKMLIIRSPAKDVAFCGGVDLAFTRRDAPADPDNFTAETVLDGDWQSGRGIPGLKLIPPGIIWPPNVTTTDYTSATSVNPNANYQQGPDLPMTTDSKDVCEALRGEWNNGVCSYKEADGSLGKFRAVYGDSNQHWHDQHLKLEGPIVSTLEWQFWERWSDSPRLDSPVVHALQLVYDPIKTIVTDNLRLGSVCFSTDMAFTLEGQIVTINSKVVPLETPIDISQAAGPSVVQMWRTISMRNRTTDLFKDGEFTIMAGIAKAVSNAKELIWIFDQYFWSQPVARLLNYRLLQTQNLRVLIILPPHADSQFPEEHRARQLALTELTQGLSTEQRARVGIYNMWHPKGRGIYVHAKAHTYDGALLVCGSANMNRRSLTCDSELACAVVDPDVVAGHQQKLWNMLFANVKGEDGAWQPLDKGSIFLTRFAKAAASSDAYLVPDPWDDDNPLRQPPPPAPQNIVALPNGLPRPAAFLGPKYEIMYGFALDPGSLDPVVESDIKTGDSLIAGTAVPRPARLDDIVTRVEHGTHDSPPKYIWRKQANFATEQVFRLPAIVYVDGGYHFTDQSQWWKEVCIGFPCFFALGWPGYQTTIIEDKVDGQDVVIQLWKGWCERFGEIDGMPGGVGVEVGVYHRIPKQFAKFKNQVGGKDILQQMLTNALKGVLPDPTLPKKIQVLLDKLYDITDENLLWWPFPELNANVEFKFKNNTTDAVLFEAEAQNTYWRCKWMDAREYDKFAPDHQVPTKFHSPDNKLWFKVTGQKSSPLERTWAPKDGKAIFP